jgi:hypothetical protein
VQNGRLLTAICKKLQRAGCKQESRRDDSKITAERRLGGRTIPGRAGGAPARGAPAGGESRRPGARHAVPRVIADGRWCSGDSGRAGKPGALGADVSDLPICPMYPSLRGSLDASVVRRDWPAKCAGTPCYVPENSRCMSTRAGNARYDLAVANLKVAPVGSTGGNLRSANSDPVALLTAMGTSMLRPKAAPGPAVVTEGSAEALSAAPSALYFRAYPGPYFRAYLGPSGASGAHMRAAEPRGSDHAKQQLTRARYLPGIEAGLFPLPREHS